MKKQILFLLFLPSVVWAQDYNIPFRPQVVVSGGTVLCKMDFEGVGCFDTGGDEAESNFNSYNCDYSTTSIGTAGAALLSGYTVGDDTNRTMNMDTDCANTTKVTMDFKIQFPNGSKTQRDDVAGIRTSAGQFFKLAWRQSNTSHRMYCGISNVQESSILSGMSANATYNVRLNYDGSLGQCTWYIDTSSSGNWGTGTVNTGSLDSTDTGDFNAIFHREDDDGTPSIIDDIGVCDATNGFLAEGVKCGD